MGAQTDAVQLRKHGNVARAEGFEVDALAGGRVAQYQLAVHIGRQFKGQIWAKLAAHALARQGPQGATGKAMLALQTRDLLPTFCIDDGDVTAWPVLKTQQALPFEVNALL